MSLSTIKFRPFHARKSLNWAIFAVLAITLGSICLFVRTQASAASLSPVAEPASVIHYKNAPTSVTPATVTVVQSSHTQGVAAAPQTCAPDTSYSQPSALSLDGSPNGLSQIIEPISYYTVYGNSANQILSQIQRCAPNSNLAGGESQQFAAETGYNLSWKYSWASNASGQCAVNNVKIGLHINMVLPRWQATAAADPGLTAQWQSFINGLTTHENGHAAIDQQYANQIVSDLQFLPATDCSSIDSLVQNKINSDIAALNSANDAYDAATNHGATQGAILP